MKVKLIFLMYFIIFSGLFFQPACSTSDGCTFDIIGTWEVTMTWDGSEAFPWDQTLTFSGSSSSGTVSGIKYVEGTAGTYTVNDCSTVQVIVDYINSDDGCHALWTWDGTSISDTSLNGTMEITFTGPTNLCGSGSTGTWTATKK